MKKFIIIQARTTSTRFPKKILQPICEKTALEIMIERLKKFKDDIIIATTNSGSEKPIVEICEKLHIKYFKGDEENVLKRFFDTAIYFGAKDEDLIVRLTSDCPLIAPDILEKGINKFLKKNPDYLSNTINRTYPRGLDFEIFNFKVLKEAYFNAKNSIEKEHVTPYIHTTHKDKFKIVSLEDSENFSKFRLTLDEKADLIAIREVYKLLNCKTDFSYEELKNILRENEYIYYINCHIEQKKDDLDRWCKLHKKIEENQKDLFIREREIYFLHIGINIGDEAKGKGNEFLRPVLVLKKLSHTLFIGVPLTSKKKEGKYYFKFNYKYKKESYAMLNQIRVFDKKRIKYFSGRVNKNIWNNLIDHLKAILPTKLVGSAYEGSLQNNYNIKKEK